jgi:hypothetical protein
VRGREFGDAIRALLRAAGLTNRAAAELLGWQEAKISDLVKGKGGTSEVELAQLLGLLRTPASEFEHLKDWLQRKPPGKLWHQRTLTAQEKLADKVIYLSLNVVHGQLQVPEYIRCLIPASGTPADQVDDVLAHRMARQELISWHPDVTVYMQEHALRLPVGDQDVMSRQLHHLLRMSVRPNLTLRAIPTALGCHAGITGDFSLLKFEKPLEPIVFLESVGVKVILEDRATVAHYETIAEALSRVALSPDASRRLITDIINEEACDRVVQG